MKKHIPKKFKFLGITLMLFLFASYIKISAIDNPYQAGETLDPNCAPGEVNCTVEIGGGASPFEVINSTNLFSTGLIGTGDGVNLTNNSNFIGEYSGNLATDANGSNFLGGYSGYNATYASYSNFLGNFAGNLSTNASESNFIGRNTGEQATNASSSNFIGKSAGQGATNSSNSNFIGTYAGVQATDAPYSNFIGHQSGVAAFNSSYSNFIGYFAGEAADNAINSNFIGTGAGRDAANASYSTFIGYKAGGTLYGTYASGAANASNSIFIGQNAGYRDTVNNTTDLDDWSILLGYNTNTGGFKNSILLGGASSSTPISNTKANQFMLAPSITELRWRGIDYTLPSSQGGAGTVLKNDGSGGLTWGTDDTGGGGGLLSDADFNTVGGTNAGLNLVSGAGYNTFIGYETGKGGVVTNGADENTAIGAGSLSSLTTGYGNTSTGVYSLYANTTGYVNTAYGGYSLSYNTTGYGNSSFGTDSMMYNTTGNSNTAVGNMSLEYNTTASFNTAIGAESLFNINTGGNNTALGYRSGRYISGGSTNTTSSNSLYLGYDTRASANGNTNEIVIGYNAIGNGSNTVTVGNSSILRTYLRGLNLAAGTATSGTAPLKFTAGTNLTLAEAGAIEWDGTNLFITQTTGPTRKTIAYTSDITSSPVVAVATSGLSTSSWGAGSANNSFFFGSMAGYSSSSATTSFFIGNGAGQLATSANASNFLGQSSGQSATNANHSNFFGTQAGGSAINANNSNFLGWAAGLSATNASNSNFFGKDAGYNATNASNSIFLGYSSGNVDTVNNTGNIDDFSILIGPKTSTGGFSNSIAIGAYATNTATNEFMIGSTTRPINTTVWKGTSTTATLDTATGLITTSDERLKTNIEDLPSDTLDKLLNVKTVTFNWLEGDNDKTNIGFLAQDLENYFPELVYTGNDKNKYKGVNYANMTPILVEAIRELDLKVEEMKEINPNTFGDMLSDFGNSILVNIENGIAYMKDIAVETLRVGSSEKRTGITLYDEETGDPYCLSISGGEQKIVSGECGIITNEELPITSDSEKESGDIVDESATPDEKTEENIIPENTDVDGGEIVTPEGEVVEESTVEEAPQTPEPKEDPQPQENVELSPEPTEPASSLSAE